MKFRIILTLLFLLPSWLISEDGCLREVDFHTWVREGNTSYGNWEVAGDGKSVIQKDDALPSFFLNNDELINVKITGEINVQTGEDDDFIGFVFGYKSPNENTDPTEMDYWLFTWKKSYENYNDYIAQEGFSLVQVKGTIEDEEDAYYRYFWEQPSDDFFKVIATKWDEENGWAFNRNHKFELIYTTTRIIIIIDTDTIFSINGCFEQGRFGFFNFSQPNVTYKNFNYELASEFIPMPDVICQGEPITFKSTCSKIPTNIKKWEWDFNDGETSDEINPEHSFSSPGVFNVKLVITDEIGCQDSVTRSVVITPLPDAEIIGDMDACENNPAVYTCTPGMESEIQWDIQGGTLQGVSNEPTLKVKWGNTGQGKLTVHLKAVETGCMNQNSVTVNIKESPTVKTLDDTEICPNEIFQLSAEPSGGNGDPENYTYSWTPEDGLDDPDTQNPTLQLSSPGTINYAVTVTDEDGCKGTDYVRITVRPSPELTSEIDSIAYGEFPGCEEYVDTIINIENPTSENITIIAAGREDIFEITNPLPLSFAPKAKKDITIRFRPVDDVVYDDTLFILFDPCEDTLAIPFTAVKQGLKIEIPDTLDLGEVVLCSENKSNTVDFDITNMSSEDMEFEVESINLSDYFNSNISVGEKFPYNLKKTFNVTFAPDATLDDGEILGELEILLQPCNIRKIIYLKAVKSEVILTFDALVDFGLVDFGTQPEKKYLFVNDGGATVIIKEANLSNSAAFHIEDIQPPLEAELKPGDTLIVTASYTPGVGIETSDLSVVSENPCDKTFTGKLKGESTLEAGSAILTLGSARASSGDRIQIPLTISESKFILENGVTQYDMKIRFDKSMLLPYGSTSMGVIDGNDRVISISAEIDSQDEVEGVLQTFEFTATFGADSCTDISLEDIVWTGGEVNVTEINNGRFCLDDICDKGQDSRFLIESGSFGINSVYPNPTNNNFTIKYETEEKGYCELSLINTYGEVIKNIRIDNPNAGPGEKEIEAKELSSGSYTIILRTTSQQDQKILHVVK